MNKAYVGLLAAMLLTACASPIKTVEVPYAVGPSAEFLKECVAERVEVRTNADLVRDRNAIKKALDLCNADKAALRAWNAEISK